MLAQLRLWLIIRNWRWKRKLEWIKRTRRQWPDIAVMLIRDWAEDYLDRHYLDEST